MKIRAAFVLAIALVAASMAASPIASAATVTNQAVRGQLASIFSFCARIYPPGREVYRGLKKQLLGTDDLDRDDRLEGPPEYRIAFDAASDAFTRIPLHQALQACQAIGKG